MREGVNKLREQIARVLKLDEKNMTRTWRKMLKTVLAESESMMRKELSKRKKGGQKFLVDYLDTTGLIKDKHK